MNTDPMAAPSSLCPQCGKGGAHLIRVLSTETHYFCDSCVAAFVQHTAGPTAPNERRMATSHHHSSYVAFRRKHVIA
jgi:hypothetical protein